MDRGERLDDQSLIRAQRWLWDHVRTVCELGAAAGLAAMADGRFDNDPGPIGIIVCGANVDPRKFIR